MDRTRIDALLGRIQAPTPGREPDPRVKAVVDRIVHDLFHAIEDLDVTPSEFWTACAYLSELGRSGEVGLLAPGLGFEHFLDLRMDEAEARAGLDPCATPRTIEGPLYVAGAPVHEGQGRLDDGSDADAEPLFVSGVVRDGAGRPVPGAAVEVWHANSKGAYSVFDPAQSRFNGRGTIRTGADGRYAFRSIVPCGYACPPDGPTQRLLDLLGRHGQRPAHIHFLVSARGFRRLTTQINIQDDPLIDDDFAFATRDGLAPEIVRRSDPAALGERGVDRPFAEIAFDFALAEAREGLPDDAVERARVAA